MTHRAAACARHGQPSSMKVSAMQHAHTTPATPWQWRVILGRLAVLRVTSGAPGTAWERCLWGWTCPVACSGACLASPLYPRWSLSSRPPLSRPHQLPRHRDRQWRRPPGTRVHTRRAPLPLSLRALAAGTRAPRRSPLSRPRARRTHSPARCALACRPRAGSWGQRGLRHPDSQPVPSSGRTERTQRWGTSSPVSAVWCDAASCAVTRARHGGRARRHPEPTTLVGRCAVGCAPGPSSPLSRWHAGGIHLGPDHGSMVPGRSVRCPPL